MGQTADCRPFIADIWVRSQFNLQKDLWWGNIGRDSIVSIANRYGLDGTRFEHRYGRHFLWPSRHNPRPTQPPVGWVLCLFPGGKVTGAWG